MVALSSQCRKLVFKPETAKQELVSVIANNLLTCCFIFLGVHVDVACKYNKPETMFAFAFRTHAHELGKYSITIKVF